MNSYITTVIIRADWPSVVRSRNVRHYKLGKCSKLLGVLLRFVTEMFCNIFFSLVMSPRATCRGRARLLWSTVVTTCRLTNRLAIDLCILNWRCSFVFRMNRGINSNYLLPAQDGSSCKAHYWGCIPFISGHDHKVCVLAILRWHWYDVFW
jgi:hypothetical protein